MADWLDIAKWGKTAIDWGKKGVNFFKKLFGKKKSSDGTDWKKIAKDTLIDVGTDTLKSLSSSAIQTMMSGQQSLWLTKQGIKFQKDAEKRQFNYVKALQENQQQYEAAMSNTAHQREVTDLQKAGLNPILSANGGASTPSTGLGSVGLSNDEQAYTSQVATALEMQRLNNEKAATKANIALMLQQADTEAYKRQNLESDSLKNRADELYTRLQTEWLPREMKVKLSKIQKETELLEYNAITDRIKAEAANTGANASVMTSKALNAQVPSAVAKNEAEARFKDRESGGYSKSFKLGPIQYSYTEHDAPTNNNNNKNEKPKYKWVNVPETRNGKTYYVKERKRI